MLRDLGRETAMYGTAMIFGGLVQLAFLPFMSAYLSASEAGELGILATASGVIATVVALGLPMAIIRAWQRSADRMGLVSRGLLLPLIPASVILAASILFPGFLGGLMRLESSRNLIHASLLGVGVAYVQLSMSFLRAEGRASRYLTMGISRGLGTVTLLVLLLLLGVAGVRAFLVARWIPAFAAAAVVSALVLRGVRGVPVKRESGGGSLTGSLMSFGLPLMPASLAMLALSSADMFMLRHLHPDPAQSGYYYWANTACMIMVPLTAGFEMAWPRFIFRVRDTGGTLGQLGRASLAFLVVVVWAAALIGLAGPEIAGLVGGERFSDVATVLPTLIGATAMYSVFLVSQTGPLLTGQTKFIAGMTLFGAVVNIGFNVRLIPVAGAMGAAFATLGTNMFMALSLFWLGRKVFPINPLVVILVVGPLIAIGPVSRMPGLVRGGILVALTLVCAAVVRVLVAGSGLRSSPPDGGGGA